MSKYTIVVPVIGDSSDNHAINLAKLMAQQNKGQVFILKSELGKGTTFRISLGLV